MDLRRAAEHDPRRGPLGGPVERDGVAPASSASTRRSRCAPTRRRGLRSTSAAAPTCWCPATCTTTSSTRKAAGKRADVDRAGRRRRVAAVRQHARPAAARRAGQLVGQAAGPDHAATADDNDRVAPAIGQLPGVVVTPQADLLPTDDAFAPDHRRQVKKAVVDELDGEAGWRVVSVNQNGVDVDVLNEVPGKPAPSVSMTPGPRGPERRAGRRGHRRQAGDDRGDQAVDRRDPGDRAERRPPTARDRWRPPACIRRGRRSRSSPRARRSSATWPPPTRCWPARAGWTSATAPMPNYGGFDLGTVPMSRAFASSCNTTFAELASRMPPTRLDDGRRPVRHRARLRRRRASPRCPVRCRRPSTWPSAPRTASGRARCVVSPFGMALAAATVAAGKTPVPQLILGRPTGDHRRSQRRSRRRCSTACAR